jgi:uncharacterized protein YndB with AHSA1/START domain
VLWILREFSVIKDNVMTNVSGKKRVDSGSRVIKASPRAIYGAFLDPQAVAAWRPPAGMKCEIFAFDPREGGTFRMSFAYTGTDHPVRGKTSEHADVFQGRFVKLIPDERIVELIEFTSDDPAFAGAMTVTTILEAVAGGTKVTILCENVPPGIQPGDHQAGITSTLNNLAAFTE